MDQHPTKHNATMGKCLQKFSIKIEENRKNKKNPISYNFAKKTKHPGKGQIK